MKIVVVADFDETLVLENTLIPLFRRLSGRSMSQVVATTFRNLRWFKIGPHQAIKAQMYREILTGNGEGVIRRTAKEMADSITDNVFALAKVSHYRNAGAAITVASASLKPFVESLLETKYIQVDRVIGSLPAQNNVFYTGELEGGECVGKRKAERSKEMLDQHYRGYWVVVLGNLPADRELMELADEAYVVDGTNIKKYEY